MADSNVSISFGADASDFLDGVARVSAALQDAAGQCRADHRRRRQDHRKVLRPLARAPAALWRKWPTPRARPGASQQDRRARASLAAINGEISAERAALGGKEIALRRVDETEGHERRTNVSRRRRRRWTKNMRRSDRCSKRSLQLGDLSLQQRQQVLNRMLMLDAKYALRKPEDHVAVGPSKWSRRWTT